MDESTYRDYERITLAVESLIAHHPEFNPQESDAYSAEERKAFQEVWLPDWDSVSGTYRDHFDWLYVKHPDLIKIANEALGKFAEIHGVSDLNGLRISAGE
ncbi:MAG: hypothetical protein IT206_05040 [Fimbriimonadaceae bacterium]|nr:hypothetical protein [Fimbriimonadaceae bacterium]